MHAIMMSDHHAGCSTFTQHRTLVAQK